MMEEHEPAGYHWYRGFRVTPCLPTTGIVAVIITVSTPCNFTTEKKQHPIHHPHYHLAKCMATSIDAYNAFTRLYGMVEEHESAGTIGTASTHYG
jgi:hypothetical protein